MKTCTKCKEVKELSEFFKDKHKSDGHRPDCKVCNTKSCGEYAKKNRESINYTCLKYKTGLSRSEYESILLDQEHKCALCKTHTDDLTKKLSVDHCHDTMFVRGLLCTKCNMGLGYFNDDIELMQTAINYLTNNLSIKEIKHK